MLSKLSAFLIGLVAIVLLSAAASHNDFFSKYKSIEAYEVRPGILAIPRYTADGQVCEIGLEKLHYSPNLIRTESSFSDLEINQLIEQFAPPEVRGLDKPMLPGHNEAILVDGATYTTDREYENVEVEGDGGVISSSKRKLQTTGDVVVVIKWRNRNCQ